MSLFNFNWRSFLPWTPGIPEVHHRCYICQLNYNVTFTDKIDFESPSFLNKHICKKCRKKYSNKEVLMPTFFDFIKKQSKNKPIPDNSSPSCLICSSQTHVQFIYKNTLPRFKIFSGHICTSCIRIHLTERT